MSVDCNGSGTVEEVFPDGTAAVRVSRVEACQACRSRAACHALGGQVHEQIVRIDNILDAEPGQRVRLAMSEGSILEASLVLYAVPAVALLVGAVAGASLAGPAGWSPDGAAILGSMAGLGLGLGGVRLLDRLLGKRRAFTPRMVAIEGT